MTSSKKKPRPSPSIPNIPEHQPFSWLDPDLRSDQAAQFIAFVLDMSQGIHKCLSALHANSLLQEHGDPDSPPLLNAFDTDVMFRWSLASTDTMAEKAQACVDYLNDLRARQRKA
ncbi:hypothetical protein [Paraherbaspirillum soli]|uniref:Uncharacterized protein n=1 Tax=Paraherbaspirillum soli TaxID=631222 RepID=A0ABW0M727_9BURK